MVEHVAHRKKRQYDPMSPPQFPAFGTVPILPHTFQIVLRLSRPRTWTFAASSFILGYTLAGGTSLFQIALGLAVAGLVTAATNVVNAFADRREDVVNQPSRVFWVEQIGPHGTIISIIALYALAFTASLFLGPLFMLVLAVGVFNSIFYSARRLWSRISQRREHPRLDQLAQSSFPTDHILHANLRHREEPP